ncbi:MAG TPA: SEC59/DGK1/VTE5 family protein [Methanomassiliicoccales archaeon]|nr:SEC59/DGK1/VTE5 family protein [Methanomassiliicoccales archaeon]
MFGQGDIVGLVAVYAYVALVIVLASKLGFVKRVGAQRKFVHIMVGNIVLIWWVFESNLVMAFLAAAPFVPLLLLASSRSPIKRVRESFIGKTTGESHNLGLVYYAISWTLLAFFLFDDLLVASIAIVSMSYGDGIGGLVGKAFGKRRLVGKKTLEGTLTVLVATTVASLAVIAFYGALTAAGLYPGSVIALPVALGLSAVVGVFVAVVELLTPGQYDNLTIPLGTALLLVLLGV